jgi:formate-dependent phosphoribosylglycinamide formyltransferase (GAR transformylase)
MLWLKLLEVKAKHPNHALTSEEKAICKAAAEENFNIPQPIIRLFTGNRNLHTTERAGVIVADARVIVDTLNRAMECLERTNSFIDGVVDLFYYVRVGI